MYFTSSIYLTFEFNLLTKLLDNLTLLIIESNEIVNKNSNS